MNGAIVALMEGRQQYQGCRTVVGAMAVVVAAVRQWQHNNQLKKGKNNRGSGNSSGSGSVYAKKRGYIVSMAPIESYNDPMIEVSGIDAVFLTDLDLPPRSYTYNWYGVTNNDRDLVRRAGFYHAGRQCYAYVLARPGGRCSIGYHYNYMRRICHSRTTCIGNGWDRMRR